MAYVFFRYIYLSNKKKSVSNVNPRLKMINSGVKRRTKDVRKPAKSLRMYIKQNSNHILIMFFAYLLTVFIVILGGVLSTRIFFDNSRVKVQNQTEKERFVSRIIYQIKYLVPGTIFSVDLSNCKSF